MSEKLYKSVERSMAPSEYAVAEKLAKTIGVSGSIFKKKPRTKAEIAQTLVDASFMDNLPEAMKETERMIQEGVKYYWFHEVVGKDGIVRYRLKANTPPIGGTEFG